jgi:4'-phosphopantetheinyl transferase
MIKDAMATLALAFVPCPKLTLPLPAERIAHVWKVDLEEASDPILSPDEQTRAQTMRHSEKQRHFIRARSALRLILAKYTGLSPADIPLATATEGKPHLDLAHAPHFNLTHAHGKALVAVARVPVGIDLEFPRPVRQLDQLVADYFSSAEARDWASLDEEDRARAFLGAWTRKEAFLKATGEGIAGGLHRFDVSLLPDEEARLKAIDGDVQAAASWTLHAFTPFENAQAAICLAAPNMSLLGFTL